MKIGYVRVSKQEQHVMEFQRLQTAQFPSENDQYSIKLCNMDLQNHRLSDKLYCKGEVVKVGTKYLAVPGWTKYAIKLYAMEPTE